MKASAPADVALALINIKSSLTDLSFVLSGLADKEQLQKAAELTTQIRDEAGAVRRWIFTTIND